MVQFSELQISCQLKMVRITSSKNTWAASLSELKATGCYLQTAPSFRREFHIRAVTFFHLIKKRRPVTDQIIKNKRHGFNAEHTEKERIKFRTSSRVWTNLHTSSNRPDKTCKETYFCRLHFNKRRIFLVLVIRYLYKNTNTLWVMVYLKYKDWYIQSDGTFEIQGLVHSEWRYIWNTGNGTFWVTVHLKYRD